MKVVRSSPKLHSLGRGETRAAVSLRGPAPTRDSSTRRRTPLPLHPRPSQKAAAGASFFALRGRLRGQPEPQRPRRRLSASPVSTALGSRAALRRVLDRPSEKRAATAKPPTRPTAARSRERAPGPSVPTLARSRAGRFSPHNRFNRHLLAQ